MGIVMAVCVSEKKGTAKKNAGKATLIENYGLQGDAHAGGGHRQVSLLSLEKIEAFKCLGAKVTHGAFGENLVVEGIDFAAFSVGTLFRCGNILLRLSQIGKECHSRCAIFHTMGDCIMPREGVFAEVLKGGEISVGDEFYAE
jgi:TatD DNase family protein